MIIDNQEYVSPVSEIVGYSMYHNKSVPSILDQWSKNKYDLYKRFGDKTIIKTSELSLAIDNSDEVRISYIDFCDHVPSFIQSPVKREAFFHFLFHAVDRQGFKNNIVMSDWNSEKIVENLKNRMSFSYDEDLTDIYIKVPKGMKFSKAMKMFFDVQSNPSEEQQLKDMQNKYSTYRQSFSSKKKGRIFLSIDPFDYLSISDNNHNWSSCHSMLEGEYRIGNLNYMADGVTMVGYYASSDKFDEELEAFQGVKTWNSKRWRVLVHVKVVDGQLMVAYNRQYPFKSEQLILALDELLMSVFQDTTKSNFMAFESGFSIQSPFLLNKDDTCQYGDFRSDSNCHIRFSESLIGSSIEPILVGEPVLCLKCGNYITNRAESGLCDDCTDEFYCDDCGDYCAGEDMHWLEEENRYICYRCYENRYSYCDICDSTVLADEVLYVELLQNNVCRDCLEKMNKSPTSFIFTMNESFLQQTDKLKTNEELKKLYEAVSNDLDGIKKFYAEQKPDVILIPSLILKNKFIIYSSYEDTAGYIAFRNSTYDHKDYPRIFRVNEYTNSPLGELEYYFEAFNNIQDVILLGVTSKETLEKNIQLIFHAFDILGLDKEKLDYSRVRVI